jgi:hypothetical protein
VCVCAVARYESARITTVVAVVVVVVVLHLISAREQIHEVQVPHLQSTINQ